MKIKEVKKVYLINENLKGGIIMKKLLIMVAMVVFVPTVFVPTVSAQSVGINAGYTLPASTSLQNLNGAISFGIFVRTPSMVLSCADLVLDGSYALLTDKNDSNIKMTFIPITLSAEIAPIPDFGILPYLKVGGGIVLETLKTSAAEDSNIDAVFLGGIGARLKLGSNMDLKLEGVYSYIYEKYITGATQDGGLISITAGVSYKF
jgi:hypothetical protein